MTNFVHLHVHTEYSLLDGANRIKDLIPQIKKLGMDAIAITDHGVMYGVIDFYKTAIKNGIKPILGCEVYTAKRTRFDKLPNIDSDYGHLVLLAKDNIGYKNLMKIVSLGFTEGFYYKPRVDFEILAQYSKGLIALSACLGGDVPTAIMEGNFDKAKELALKYKSIFQDDFYFELQSHGIKEQNLVNQKLIEFSNELDIPLVATNDSHYLRREDSLAHEILLCIQTGKNINDEDRMTFDSNEFYIKSPDEMFDLFKNVPQAIENSVKIAQMCNVELDFGKLHLPHFDVPENQNSDEYFKNLCYAGLEKKYGESAKAAEKIARLDFEITVIKKMGYIDYFLIVWDFIKYAKDNGIVVGPGRGSAAGSLVSYCLDITNIEPLKYNLLFERFLNPERISMPDIDIDFCYERRGEVIDYVVRKYGKDRVAQIITFGTMAARAAIRDVGRALNIPYGEVDAIAKLIPMKIGMTLTEALKLTPELRQLIEAEEMTKRLIETAILLEGMPRHASTHAAGVVISKDPVNEYVPLQLNENVITTQFTMGILEELGLLKMDFLGLRTLTVIRDTIELVQKTHGIKIDIDNLEIDDADVYKMISEGKTSGVFQLESQGMTQFMKELVPKNLEDIIAGISLYRPGPMDQIPRYIANKKNPANIKYPHPLLEKILDVTYGCMVYQEQVMQIVRDVAGYSMGRSDLVRRMMSKKKLEVMIEERKNFIYGIVDENGVQTVVGALANGMSEDVANKIFDEMLDFASYAFNKSHAAAYAVVAYQTAYLKFYYPVEFMAASLNSFVGTSDKISQYIFECKTMGITILPPDINKSELKFSVHEKQIRFGMSAVKNVGEAQVASIIRERNNGGYFKSFVDFCQRMDSREINKRALESLIKCGGFDNFNISRSKLINSFEKILDSISQSRKKNLDGQMSLFDMPENSLDKINMDESTLYPDIAEYPKKMLLSMEKEMLGIYVSGHPLSEFETELKNNVSCTYKELMQVSGELDDASATSETQVSTFYDGQRVIIGGIVSAKKLKTTKNNSMMAFITIEDFFGPIEIIVFASQLEKYSKLLELESIVVVKGTLSIREDEPPKLKCDEVYHPSAVGSNSRYNKPAIKGYMDNTVQTPQIKPKKLYLRIFNSTPQNEYQFVVDSLKNFNGINPVYIHNADEKTTVLLEPDKWTNLNESLLSGLIEKLGEDNVKIV